MQVELKLFMGFREYLPADSDGGKTMVSLKEGSTIVDLLNTVGIPSNKPKVLVINEASYGMSQEVNARALEDGDVIAVFPPVGGG